jgi:hypothetical protein
LFRKSDYGRIIDRIIAEDGPVNRELFDSWSEGLRAGVSGVLGSDHAGDRYFDIRQKLELNAARFSAAKAYQATQIIRRQQTGKNGEPLPDGEFRKRAKDVLNQFNRWYETERHAAIARARTAEQWIDFHADPVRNELFPNIRWIPSRSATPREEHMPYYNRVWAKNDPFWTNNQPGTLWGCKCDWEETDAPADCVASDIPSARGLKGNPAETGEIFSPDATYFSRNALANISGVYYKDGSSDMKINVTADKTEIADNVRTGRILLNNFKGMDIKIRPHVTDQSKGRIKNPEYEINGRIADAKRLESWNVASCFNSAMKQGCKAIVLDLFKMQTQNMNSRDFAKNIVRRFSDFTTGKINECYVVWKDNSMVINQDFFDKYTDSRRFNYVIEMERKIRQLL